MSDIQDNDGSIEATQGTPPESIYPDAPHKGPPVPKRESDTVHLYRLDPETHLPIIVGKVFIDKDENAWVRINAQDLAAGIGVEDIDGVALLDKYHYDLLEE